MIRRLWLAVVLVSGVVAGCGFPVAGAGPVGGSPTASSPSPGPSTSPPAGTVTAIAGELRRARVVAARPEVAGYRRDKFGQAWSDDHGGPGGHNGCDTRNDVLGSQLQARKYRGTSRCVVVEGTLAAEPYTGRRVEFRKEAAAKVQIDHIYPLARAWDLGASRWSQQRRVDFANDQAANLLAVDGSANASKGDAGPGEWLPINRGFRCTYVLRYLRVANKWALPITTADRASAQAVVRTCP